MGKAFSHPLILIEYNQPEDPFSSSQESRSDDYDNTAHVPRAQTSLPMDSNTRKYNSHSFSHTYRPLMTDLVSHYYPADSTLNILSAEKKRSTIADHITSSQIRDDVLTYVLDEKKCSTFTATFCPTDPC
jgi:hypothetical protein